MHTDSEDALVKMLLGCTHESDHAIIMKMIETADHSLTIGANEFVDSISKTLQPGDIKDYIRCYPLAHMLIGITHFYRLNKDLTPVQQVLDNLLTALQNQNDSAGETKTPFCQ